jgi:ribonuclease VapC
VADAVVVDSSVVLAVVHDESGAEQFGELLPGILISTVNLAEVIGRMAERNMPIDAIRVALEPLDLKSVDHDTDLAERTGLLRPLTRHLGLSLGDRACLALAQREGLPVYTADRRWSSLAIGIDVRVVR